MHPYPCVCRTLGADTYAVARLGAYDAGRRLCSNALCATPALRAWLASLWPTVVHSPQFVQHVVGPPITACNIGDNIRPGWCSPSGVLPEPPIFEQLCTRRMPTVQARLCHTQHEPGLNVVSCRGKAGWWEGTARCFSSLETGGFLLCGSPTGSRASTNTRL